MSTPEPKPIVLAAMNEAYQTYQVHALETLAADARTHRMLNDGDIASASIAAAEAQVHAGKMVYWRKKYRKYAAEYALGDEYA